jgi:pimeloyl-ACP methyl ester carboxylesterase
MQAWVVGLAALGATILIGCGGPAALRRPEPVESAGSFGFRTSDGITIAGDLELPEGGPAPLVLLGHQLYRDRTSWDPLVPRLLEAGYAVLRIDHRGCGESTREVPSPDRLTGPQRSGFPLDMLEAIHTVKGNFDVDASRIAVVAADFSVTPAVRCAMENPEVGALVLLSGAMREEEESWILEHPEMPVLMIAAERHRTAFVMRQHAERVTGPEQRYVEFGPVDETDDAKWVGTDGLHPETGVLDLIVWFLERNFPAE